MRENIQLQLLLATFAGRVTRRQSHAIDYLIEENPSWGYARIQGALKHLDHRVARSTIAKVLKEHGIKPSPERPMSWRTFVRAHAHLIAAADFFTTEVWTGRGLVRYFTLFVIDIATRRSALIKRSFSDENRSSERSSNTRLTITTNALTRASGTC